MAKVIKQGIYQKVHKACGSLIEFAANELKEDWSSDYLGDREYFRALSCPSCGGQMKFPQYGNLD